MESLIRSSAEIAAGWLSAGKGVASAQLISVDGSAPLEPGATMFVSDQQEIEGSITGGCVEGAVAAEAAAVLAGAPPRRVVYGISDELAGTVGLSCGGTVHIFVRRLAGAWAEVELAAIDAAAAGSGVAIATILDGDLAGAGLAVVDGEARGTFGGPELLDRSVTRDADGMLARGVSGIRHYGVDGATTGTEISVYVRSLAPSPTMFIFGAIDFSAALGRLASELGYAVTICDAREPFVRSPRFENVGQILVGWPEEALKARSFGPRDVILVFTHDPKFDEPALIGAVKTGAGYIGALGSRRTTADRNRRLREARLSEAEVGRIHSPCGLDIGGVTPGEVAISVLAEIIAERSNRSARALRDGDGPIRPGNGHAG